MPLLRDLLDPAPLLLWCCALLIAAALAIGSVREAAAASGGAQPALIGVFGAWRAATHRAAGRLVCYAYTRSVSSAPHLPGRGGVVLTITERKGAPRDAVALSAGFTYPQGANVSVLVGADHLRFYTAGRSAFARSGRGAASAFGGAARAVARSPAPHGRSVTDVFSLEGFAAAHRAIERSCPLGA